jgi:hypothetical protein
VASISIVLERLTSSGHWIKVATVTVAASDEPRWAAKASPGTYRALVSAVGPSGTAEAIASPRLERS